MPNLKYILFRRLRSPLIALIVVYAIFITGFVLIPGQNGIPMSFFDAFYFVSFMGTTIGFGEITESGLPFTYPQRAWTLLAIYATVITWLYGIGSLLSILQDPAFRRLMLRNKFIANVQEIREPFYIICGYGETGKQLVHALAEEGIRSVVIDHNEDQINELELADLGMQPLGIVDDASRSEVLQIAGVTHDWCRGVVSLASDDNVNLTVAIAVQLLNPKARLIARAESPETENNILSFGANEVINPFETFAERLALAIRVPSLFILFEWMSGVPGESLVKPFFIPKGYWVCCGFGRFGQAVYNHLTDADIMVNVIEADPNIRDVPSGSVLGRPTEASSLKKAGIDNAVGIIAGTDNDADNLSTVMTSHELNKEIFMVARQSRNQNNAIFQAANIDLIMQRGDVIAHKIFALIRTPLLGDFLRIASRFKEEKANILVSRVIGVVDEESPKVWEFVIDETQAPALADIVEKQEVIVADLFMDPRDRSKNLMAMPLFLKRGNGNVMLPEDNRLLHKGDRLLMCGSALSRSLMQWTTRNAKVLEYVLTGEENPQGYLWNWINRVREEKRAASTSREVIDEIEDPSDTSTTDNLSK